MNLMIINKLLSITPQSSSTHNLLVNKHTTNRKMSESKGWTLQSSLLTLWMEKTRVNNQTKIDDDGSLLITL